MSEMTAHERERTAAALAVELTTISPHTVNEWYPLVYDALSVGIGRQAIIGASTPTRLRYAIDLAIRSQHRSQVPW